jgi:uncharacterized membrane protein
MPEAWEILTLRGLAGNAEPVESVTVAIKRTVLVELHENLWRLLARSTGSARRTS